MRNDKRDCLTGACPPAVSRDMNTIRLSEGSGGREMQALIDSIRGRFPRSAEWKNTSDDAASYPIDGRHILFTSDSYVVTPVFFPGGNIGKIAFCGTVNDLAVMGARPIGLSLSLVLEEGFSKVQFIEIIETIAALSEKTGIPIVTGDTKVVERDGIDKIIINTSGVGVADRVLCEPLAEGDRVIVSGGIGEHGTALLAKRYELESSVVTDSKPLHEELSAIGPLVKQAKDITRGGLAAILNELAQKNRIRIAVDENRIPIHDQVRALTEILGIDVYSLACEGRFVCIASPAVSGEVVEILRRFDATACVIGEVGKGEGVTIQTMYGKTILSAPSGNIVPRIC